MNGPAENMNATRFVELNDGAYPVHIEYQWLNAERAEAPIALFLHEGLGSIALWKDWPQTLCDRLECRGLVYSRPGYGRSTPRRAQEKWPVEFLHRQAHDVLPALLDALGIGADERARMWLFGHSDGGTIALLYASAFPEALAGLAIMAPHVFVETMTVEGIEKARRTYETTSFREKLSAYHDDVDSALRLERRVAESRVSSLEHHARDNVDRAPVAGDTGLRRRIRVDAATRRDRGGRPAHATRQAGAVQALAASRCGRSSERCDCRFRAIASRAIQRLILR